MSVMPEPPLQPDALDRLAREVGKERTKSTAGAAPAFGWVPGSGAPAMIGRFRIVTPVGRGGMGVVYHAIDPEKNNVEVALKSLAAGPGERLRREGEAIARLDHPGIVKILETGEELGKPFLVMEFVRGRPLDDAWVGWDLRRRVEAVEQIARAVTHAHERGVAHRDLKPSNILVGEDSAPRVTDFGLAAIEEARTKLTDPGSVMGTPAWMSPEQVRGDAAGAPADVHALGALLYLALTGTGPFDGPNAPAIYRRILDVEPEWPRKRAPSSPAALEAVCLAALEKTPTRRPSAVKFAEDLARWLAGKPVNSRLPSLAVRVLKRARRNPFAWLGLAAATVALAAGASALAVQSSRHARQDKARNMARDAQPLAAHALLALAAGDEPGAARMMEEFGKKMAAARALDGSAAGGWFESAEFRRQTGDEEGAWRAVNEGEAARPGEALLRLERGLLLAARYRREARRAEQSADASMRAGGPREAPEETRRGLAELLKQTSAELDAGIAGLGGNAPPAARVAQAELALLQGRPDDAWKLVEGLEQPEAKVVCGSVLEARGDFSGALEWFSKAIATRERFWPAWEARATARERLAGRRWKPETEAGEAEQSDAIDDWARLAKALPRRADIHVSLSTASWRLGQMRIYRQGDPTEPCRRAIAAADEAIRINPRSGEAHFAAGRAWSEIANHESSRRADAGPSYAKALEQLEESARTLPDSLDVRLVLAGTFRMRGYWKRAHGGLAFEEDYNRALREYDEVMRISPVWLPARCNQGLILFEMKRWKEAAAAFEKAGSWATDRETTRKQFEEAKRLANEEERGPR
ncbi:MAG: hypothetical protein FD180_638 [Planctomycetota bacterium]|nr:MAG: hypothetical protein FD180_638 [Planctomycetota bacterium]